MARRLGNQTLQSLMSLSQTPRDVVFEITMDSETAVADITKLRNAGATVGAGTVLDKEQAAAALDAGAEFLVSPYLDEDLVGWASAQGIPVSPGALTPTEIVRAWNAGAAAVKVFPASVAGPQLIRELRGPLGHIPLMPTGGMTAENVRGFIDAGAVAAGVGGWLTGAPPHEIPVRWEALKKAVARSQ
ncbi:bifunctional 4-hydroxy-2-oxoglutarate aldolase/2-dehydro-3-deoxy-phosphogluconate aldolase [Paenarthrobacter sp. OM7]|uniref:Bifunctional 4-hydroxy-2-oxoglutarate aldolase/2-dehydro-3-deoxy-phosphogluconate aldolase n=1 Tax=Paenarthrobacter sp. AMU7 TaxID=3162492 RepID=A0AB39YMA5_9MICC|nr:bifunctional 4-hydroxy-2-oxoglutarate aldolase/2-dehydro-3-deoxy-phosphogluconate aldolase [Paenarthrobacter sp. OM7]WGM20294.1 bifunctional 4-hydroxy-2-oxoglutarate aldolase/2-dehydro-3-deoxy-phosphogluconate aldolase [Paenarthrobacter sp. OM7]